MWTTLCAGIIFMTYVRYKEHKEKVIVKIDDEDSEGNKIFSKDIYPESVSGAMRIAHEIRSTCVEYGRTTAFAGCSLVMGIWLVRAHGAFNRLMVNRYSDIHYQIRRPDLIQEKLTAIKYLAIPGMAVPLLGAGCVYAFHARHSDRTALVDEHFDTRARDLVASITGEGHYVFDRTVEELRESPLAHFARNSRQINSGILK